MNRIIEVDTKAMLMKVEAGAVGVFIEQELAKYNVTLGHEPDSHEFSTVGGWIATRASGMKKNSYGNIEDLLVDVKFVSSIGVIEKEAPTPRVSSGPDLKEFVLGSEGTLGIITEATLKIRPMPTVRLFSSILFPSFSTGVSFVREVASLRLQPTSIRLMDNLQFRFGMAVSPRTSTPGNASGKAAGDRSHCSGPRCRKAEEEANRKVGDSWQRSARSGPSAFRNNSYANYSKESDAVGLRQKPLRPASRDATQAEQQQPHQHQQQHHHQQPQQQQQHQHLQPLQHRLHESLGESKQAASALGRKAQEINIPGASLPSHAVQSVQPPGLFSNLWEELQGRVEELKKWYLKNHSGMDMTKLCAATLLVEGRDGSVCASSLDKLLRLAQRHGGIAGGSSNGQRGYNLTFMIAYIRDFVLDHSMLFESFETSLPWPNVIPCVAGVRASLLAAAKAKGVLHEPVLMVRLTQTYDEGAVLYFYFGFNYKSVQNPIQTFEELEDEARRVIMAFGGSISHHHGVGKLRKKFLSKQIGHTGVRVLQGMKRVVDPSNVFASANLIEKEEAVDGLEQLRASL
eukprot:GHVT01005985.1.p1 GENE.GHVT01005985.1~~GHVT01005985.1.p1  ORF type:complete len:647 (+),score=99.25 GHVT01005985.1:228-1943(+)